MESAASLVKQRNLQGIARRSLLEMGHAPSGKPPTLERGRAGRSLHERRSVAYGDGFKSRTGPGTLCPGDQANLTDKPFVGMMDGWVISLKRDICIV